METQILHALYKLASDILKSEPHAPVKLDWSPFDGEDSNRIVMTLKNYKRPNGVAT